MVLSTLRRAPLAGVLRGALLAAVVTAGWLATAPFAAPVDAAPLAQELFPCDADGATTSQGPYQCHQWITRTYTVGPGGTITASWTCDAGRIPATWTYHWTGPHFSHSYQVNGAELVVTATNDGTANSGEFWLTGRCRTT
jgi:hypothetical protein